MAPRSGPSAHSISLAEARLMSLKWENEYTLSVERMGCKTEAAGCHLSTIKTMQRLADLSDHDRENDDIIPIVNLAISEGGHPFLLHPLPLQTFSYMSQRTTCLFSKSI